YLKLNAENLCFVTRLNGNSEPKTFSEASKYSHWTNATNNEMDALLRNDTYEITELPKDRKTIGIDYEEKISLVAKMVNVRCLLNLVVLNCRHGFQLDVNNAFLYDDLVETIYMKPPKGYFPAGDNKVCRLKKSLYGLKQAPRCFVALLVFVDDIIITGNDISYVAHCLSQFMHYPLKSRLKTIFKIFRYLKGSPGLGIHFIKGLGMTLKAYCDADWAKCAVTRNSVTMYFF
nr:hypothetical protein [Tanacetum cinerariifolium]